MPLKRKRQKMFDSVTKQIKNQTQGGLKVNPETGVRYEEPLEEKHPGLTIGLMAAQPGTILEKVLAPSVYKGMAKSIGEGNLSEALMASVSPVKTSNLTRLYRITGTSGKFTPSLDGTAEYAGKWFTTDPKKTLLYGSKTTKDALKSGVENPLELQVVDVPTSQLEKFRASKTVDPKKVEFEPTEDFIIPLETNRGRASIKLSGNSLKDARVELPEIPISNETIYHSKPISIAEKLGIPKAERNNLKALEDPYYWGYQQWNQRYNAAVNSGNFEEVQRLRDLHGIVKANDKKPFITWRGESKEGAKNFNLGTSPQRPGITFTSEQPHIAASYTDVPNPYSKVEGFTRQKEQRLKWIDSARKSGMLDPEQDLLANKELQLLQEKINQANSEITAGYTHPQLRKLYIYSNNPAYFDAKGAHWRHIGKDTVTGYPISTDQLATSVKNSGNDVLVIKNVRDQGNVSMNSPVSTDIIGFNQKRIKLSDPITYDDTGKVIPIVKRDNFRNPDIRHKHGGKLKRK